VCGPAAGVIGDGCPKREGQHEHGTDLGDQHRQCPTVPEGNLGGQPFQLIDAADHAVPYELTSRAGGKITLQFAAADVPSIGYATYRLVPTSGPAAEGSDPALNASRTGLENQYFRITLDPATGTIKSIYDKAQGKELLDQAAPFEGNQFVYRPNCAGANKRNICPTSAVGQWSPAHGTVKVLSSGPVSASVEVTEDPGAGGTTTGISGLTERITLYAGNPRVYISDTVNKERVDTAEEAYFAFPFKEGHPQITYEVRGDSVRFFTDQMPGSALDWQAIQSYADISAAGRGVTLSSPDAPMVEFDRIRTQEFLARPGRLDGIPATINPPTYQPSHGWVFSYVYNNLWYTNYRNSQQGTTTFHYAITSHTGGFDPVRDTRDGWGYQTPLVPLAVAAGQRGAYQPGDHPVMSVDQPGVVVQTIKQAADGAPGLTIRLLNVTGQPATVGLRLPFRAGRATLDNPAEQPQSALPAGTNAVKVPIEAHGIVTLTVIPQVAGCAGWRSAGERLPAWVRSGLIRRG
jgi:alpha-mannosidase